MKHSKWIGVGGAVLLFLSSLLPWVTIPSKSLVVTGLQSVGTNYGKPALMNLFLGGIALILFIIPRLGAKRANLFFCAANLGWAFRNFIVVSTCYAGECPEKQAGLYLLQLAAIAMLLAAVLPDNRLESQSGKKESH
jgi:hypothetical protein